MKPLAKLTLTRQRLYKKSCGLDEVPFQETASAALADYGREGGDQQNGNSTLLGQTYSKKDDDRDEEAGCRAAAEPRHIPFNFPFTTFQWHSAVWGNRKICAEVSERVIFNRNGGLDPR